MSTLGGAPTAGRALFVFQDDITRGEGKYLSSFTKKIVSFSFAPRRFIKVLPNGVAPKFTIGEIQERGRKAPTDCKDHLLGKRPELKKRKYCDIVNAKVKTSSTTVVAAISASHDPAILQQAEEITRLCAAESASAEKIAELQESLLASENARNSANVAHASEVSRLSAAESIAVKKSEGLEAKLLTSETARNSAEEEKVKATNRAEIAERSAQETFEEGTRRVESANAAAQQAVASEIERYSSTIREQNVAINGHKDRESELEQYVEQLLAEKKKLADERDQALETAANAINSMQSERESKADVEMAEECGDQQLSVADVDVADVVQSIEPGDSMELESDSTDSQDDAEQLECQLRAANVEIAELREDYDALLKDHEKLSKKYKNLESDSKDHATIQASKLRESERNLKNVREQLRTVAVSDFGSETAELTTKLAALAKEQLDTRSWLEEQSQIIITAVEEGFKAMLKNVGIFESEQESCSGFFIEHVRTEMSPLVRYATFGPEVPAPPPRLSRMTRRDNNERTNRRVPITILAPTRQHGGRVERKKPGRRMADSEAHASLSRAAKKARDNADPADLFRKMAIDSRITVASNTVSVASCPFLEDDGDDDDPPVDPSIAIEQKRLQEIERKLLAEQKKREEQQRLQILREEERAASWNNAYGDDPFPSLNAACDEANEKRDAELAALWAENDKRDAEAKKAKREAENQMREPETAFRDSGYGSQEDEQTLRQHETGQDNDQSMDFDQNGSSSSDMTGHDPAFANGENDGSADCDMNPNLSKGQELRDDDDTDAMAQEVIRRKQDRSGRAPTPDHLDPVEQTPERNDASTADAGEDDDFNDVAARLKKIELMKDQHLHESENVSGDKTVPTKPLESTGTYYLEQAAEGSLVAGTFRMQKMNRKINTINANVPVGTDFSKVSEGEMAHPDTPKGKGKRVSFADSA